LEAAKPPATEDLDLFITFYAVDCSINHRLIYRVVKSIDMRQGAITAGDREQIKICFLKSSLLYQNSRVKSIDYINRPVCYLFQDIYALFKIVGIWKTIKSQGQYCEISRK
jgi:hypothetical protein